MFSKGVSGTAHFTSDTSQHPTQPCLMLIMELEILHYFSCVPAHDYPVSSNCANTHRYNSTLRKPCPWIKATSDVKRRVKDFGLFCVCPS